ncbi:hypothetical protein AAFN85_26195 [Mucilaginibacter sp. CAU 1740]|uniref:hypothetical protein n=1 Tax=Mucilaginibacter sp. CAU 1740 TaxID=3140365 RepID=UPI00325AD08B
MQAEELLNCKNCGAVLPASTNQTIKCTYCSTVYNQKQASNDFFNTAGNDFFNNAGGDFSKTMENVFSNAIGNAVTDTLKNEFSEIKQTEYGTIKVQVKQFHFENEEAEKAFLQKQEHIDFENDSVQEASAKKRQAKKFEKNDPAVRIVAIAMLFFIAWIIVTIIKKIF